LKPASSPYPIAERASGFTWRDRRKYPRVIGLGIPGGCRFLAGAGSGLHETDVGLSARLISSRVKPAAMRHGAAL
jgi:hypothetical protein